MEDVTQHDEMPQTEEYTEAEIDLLIEIGLAVLVTPELYDFVVKKLDLSQEKSILGPLRNKLLQSLEDEDEA